MIIDAIDLENIGVYGGRQQLILTPEYAGKPIILIGGMNGGGKTTLLDAVQLALYGSKARISNRGKLGYREYLKAAIHRGADPGEGASVAISFRRVVEGEMHVYRLLRAWREGAKGIEETVEVLRDGEPDPVLGEHWDEYIESYIPSGISHLFFFDAEQIKDLADGQQAAELLGTAIHSLLGLDLVERLDNDLLALERKKKVLLKTGDELIKLREAEENLTRIDSLLEQAIMERGSIRTEADQLEKAVAKCERQFRLEGGDLFEKRTQMEDELKDLQDRLSTEENALREIAAGEAPLLLIQPLLASLEREATREAEVHKAQIVLNTLEERDERMLELMRKARWASSQLEKVESLFQEDRETRKKLVGEPCHLHADEDFVTHLRHLRSTVMPEARTKMDRHLEAASILRERIARAEATLARVPAADAIGKLQRELETLRIRLQQKVGGIQAADAKVQALIRQREMAESGVGKAREKHSDEIFGDESRRRVLKHSAKVRQTLATFRSTMIRKHAGKIERLMLESFTQLLRKTSLVTSIHIDPESFRIDLMGGDGNPLPFERLSAGERQLLATSLLWGLARASGRPLPTIIDTPLGRLDSSHRRHLVDRYFPVASHQVILLSTDEEIDEESLKRLQKFIGRSYSLHYDETLRSTQITPGYFWNHEVTC